DGNPASHAAGRQSEPPRSGNPSHSPRAASKEDCSRKGLTLSPFTKCKRASCGPYCCGPSILQRRAALPLQKHHRVHAVAVQADVPVQVRPRGSARSPYLTQYHSTLHFLTFLHHYSVKVAVHGDEALSMVNEDSTAVEKIVANDGDYTICRHFDRRSTGYSEIQT